MGGIASHRLHHRLRPAYLNPCEPLLAKHTVISDKPSLSERAILRRDIHLAKLIEQLQLQQIALRLCSEEENGSSSKLLRLSAKIDKGCRAYATAHKKDSLATGRKSETVTQRKYAIHAVACLQTGKSGRAFAHNMDKQMQLITAAIDIINGYRTPEKRCRRAINTHFHKLTGVHRWQELLTCKTQKDMIGRGMLCSYN